MRRPARTTRSRPLRRWLVILAIAAAGVAVSWFFMIRMPGKSHEGPLPPATAEERALTEALRADVEMLAKTIGKRNVWAPAGYKAAADHVGDALATAGHPVTRLPFEALGYQCENVEAVCAGSSEP